MIGTNVDRPVVLMVEVGEWESSFIGEERRRRKLDVYSHEEHLEDLDEDRLPSDTRILSPFIWSRCNASNLARLPNLRAIATRSTGFDHIDLDYCRAKEITVCNVPTYGDNTVAEHTFGLVLALTRKIHRCYERTVRGNFSLSGLRGVDLEGRTFGCVGTGRIGLHTLRIACGFNMRRLAFDPRPNHEMARKWGFEYVDLDTLLRHSDILSLHAPLNRHTRHMIDADALAKLPKGAILVNTSRGGLVETTALLEALRSGHLGGAGLDVLEEEQAVFEEAELLSREYDEEKLKATIRNNALLRMENVIITPHVAFLSEERVGRIPRTTFENIDALLLGRPVNVVNPE